MKIYMANIVGYKQIRKNKEINLLIENGNRVLNELGYTEHSRKHAAKVAETAGSILYALGYEEHRIELSKIKTNGGNTDCDFFKEVRQIFQ